jgi:hypothetical protein
MSAFARCVGFAKTLLPTPPSTLGGVGAGNPQIVKAPASSLELIVHSESANSYTSRQVWILKHTTALLGSRLYKSLPTCVRLIRKLLSL